MGDHPRRALPLDGAEHVQRHHEPGVAGRVADPGGGEGGANALSLGHPAAELFSTRTHLVAMLKEQLTDPRHDLFTRRGLGHLAGKLYALLRQHSSVTIEAIARLLGVTARHTATILSRLRRHKLLAAVSASQHVCQFDRGERA